jgi:geranylgeranyl diphosphate synthase type II
VTGADWLDQARAEMAQAVAEWAAGRRGWPERLLKAVVYALDAPGKRFRPALMFAAGRWLGIAPEPLRAPALAVEMVHTYSLVHDDLPAMDNDDWRRGRPTVHKAFDEALAILAGDALLTEAFAVLAGAAERFPARRVAEAVARLAEAAGGAGMVGGQVLDLGPRPGRIEDLRALHRAKTGAMIAAAVELPAVLAVDPVDDARRAALARYGRAVGLAFQITDDILDVVGDQAVMGKSAGRDAARGKVTYATFLGLEGARREARASLEEAQTAISGDGSDALLALARYVVERDR